MANVSYFVYGCGIVGDDGSTDWGIKKLSPRLSDVSGDIVELCRALKQEPTELPNVLQEGAAMFEVIGHHHLLVGIYPDSDGGRRAIRCVGIDVSELFGRPPSVGEVFDAWNMYGRDLKRLPKAQGGQRTLALDEFVPAYQTSAQRFAEVLGGLPLNTLGHAADVLVRCCARTGRTVFAPQSKWSTDLCELAALVWSQAYPNQPFSWCAASASFALADRTGNRLVCCSGQGAGERLAGVPCDANSVATVSWFLTDGRNGNFNPFARIIEELVRPSRRVTAAEGAREQRKPTVREILATAAVALFTFLAVFGAIIWVENYFGLRLAAGQPPQSGSPSYFARP